MTKNVSHLKLGGVVALAGYIFLCQAAPLFWGKPFYGDWINHTWMIQYYADHLRQFWTFPGTLDAEQAFGNPAPLFYGVFLYPLLSVPALFTGADLAVRIAAGVMLLTPIISMTFLLRGLINNLSLALLLSSVVNTSIYQLTNLYFRSALTEFFAYQFLLLGISLLLYGVTSAAKRPLANLFLGAAIVCLAMGTHPITVYAFAIFVAPIFLAAAVPLRKLFQTSHLILLAICAVLFVVVLSPWLLNVLVNQKHLQITTTNALAGTLHYFPTSIDSLWGRLGYFYIDPRVAAAGIGRTSTPFLDAPFAIPIACVVAGVVVQAVLARSTGLLVFIVVPLMLAILTLILVTQLPDGVAPGVLPGSYIATAENGLIYKLLLPLQFAYRLAGTWSLALTTAFVLLLLALTFRSQIGFLKHRFFQQLALASAVLSALAVSQKLSLTVLEFKQYPLVSETTENLDPSASPIFMDRERYIAVVENRSRYPSNYYSQVDYSTPGNLPRTSGQGKDDASLIVSRWGSQRSISSGNEFILRTNIVPAPTNRVEINGEPPRSASLSIHGTLDFHLPAGTHRLQVDKVGKRFLLSQVSIFVMLAWLSMATLALLSFPALASFRKRARPAPTSEP